MHLVNHRVEGNAGDRAAFHTAENGACCTGHVELAQEHQDSDGLLGERNLMVRIFDLHFFLGNCPDTRFKVNVLPLAVLATLIMSSSTDVA